MRVEVDPDIAVSPKTIGELQLTMICFGPGSPWGPSIGVEGLLFAPRHVCLLRCELTQISARPLRIPDLLY
jgi:hypothetical protein